MLTSCFEQPVDRTWIKNLATTSISPKAQTEHFAAHEDDIRGHGEQLYKAAQEAVEIFNFYTNAAKISLFELHSNPAHPATGFVLVYGRAQVKILQENDILDCRLVTLDGFEKNERSLVRVHATVDQFGGLTWKSSQQIYTTELMIKTMLAEIVKCHP